MYSSLLNTLHKTVAVFLTILMGVMLINVTWQVVSRLLLNNPSSFTEELALYLMIWIGILGASHAYRARAHLGLDLLTSKLTGSRRAVADITAEGVCILFALVVMIIGGANLVGLTLSLDQVSPALGIRVGYVYLVIPLSGCLITLYAIENLAERFGQLKHPDGGQLANSQQ